LDMGPLTEGGVQFSVESIAHALVNIYKGEMDIDHEVEEHLFQEASKIFRDAIDEGYANAAENNAPLPENAFRDAILHSADVFSAFRTHRMQKDIAAQLLDSKGQLKPFSKFVKDVSPYIEHRNRAWLQTEYDTAVIRAQNAAEWKMFEQEKDVYPNLEWIQSTSPDPGADHMIFWGTIRPVDDAFWNEHRPGDRWNCKCELRQTDKNATAVPESDGKSDAARGLETNPAKAEELFSQKHPYYPHDCMSCPFAGNKLMALAMDLAGRKNCHACKKVDNSVATAEKKSEAQQVAQRKATVMSIIRARELAEKRPGEMITVKAFKTGKMLDSKKWFKSLYWHERTAGEVKAMISFFTKPSKVKFVRISPLGEGKDLTDPKDVANIAKKQGRGVTHYNVYEFKMSDGVYQLKTEVRKKGFEIPYFICKKE
jgi:hypothetical protein